MTEQIAYWIFGLGLGAAVAIAIGKPLVEERGRQLIPAIVAGGVVVGALLGWAINGYIDYVRSSQTNRY